MKIPTDGATVTLPESCDDYSAAKRFVLYLITQEQPIGTTELGKRMGTTQNQVAKLTTQLKRDDVLTARPDPTEPRRSLYELADGVVKRPTPADD